MAKGTPSTARGKKKLHLPPPRLLFGILNWGIGHASRSIPLIKAAEKQGFEVVIASDGAALELLQKEFSDRPIHPLPSYRIRYSAQSWFLLALLFRLPRILASIKAERKAAEELALHYGCVGVISDNRFGFRVDGLPSVIITHQVSPFAGWITRPTRWINRMFLRRFQQVWIPDHPLKTLRLAGDLVGKKGDVKERYFLGWLTRFKPGKGKPIRGQALAVLSGPEPQRTILEDSLLDFMHAHPHYLQWTLVRGTDKPLEKPAPEHVNVLGLIPAVALKKHLKRAEIVVARSGYSTLMDLAVLGKKALLIPTPGQTEQEYLAKRLKRKAWVHAHEQRNIDWMRELDWALKLSGFPEHAKVDLPAGLFTLFGVQKKT